MVTVLCYDTFTKYNNIDEAIIHFEQGAECSEGAERTRYLLILKQLRMDRGTTFAYDDLSFLRAKAIACIESHLGFEHFLDMFPDLPKGIATTLYRAEYNILEARQENRKSSPPIWQWEDEDNDAPLF